jgi:hypothetical protein
VRALPKVELHCHLFGAVRRQTFSELSARAGHPVSAEEIEAFYTRGEKPVGVLRVLRALDAVLIRQPDDLYRITYEYLQDAWPTAWPIANSSGTRPARCASRALPTTPRKTPSCAPSWMQNATSASSAA